MSKRANRRGKPKDYDARLKVRCSDGILRACTTWPYGRKDKSGKQQRLRYIIVRGENA